jgi:lipopolysaccharide biosynthesis glycosyltransferase
LPLLIVTASDEHFVPGLRALLASIRKHSPQSPVCVLDCGIADATRHSLRRAFDGTEFIPIPESPELPNPSVGSRASYARLRVGELFSSADRVLYLDADTLLLSAIDYLDELVLPGECAIAACLEPYTPTFGSHNGVLDHETLGRSGATPYFNAGVLLIDVARWNALNVRKRATEYLCRQDVRITLFDQEALNVSLASYWHALPPEWNVSKYWVIEGPSRWCEIVARAKIVHFLSAEKPWADPTGVDPLLLALFNQYADLARGSIEAKHSARI